MSPPRAFSMGEFRRIVQMLSRIRERPLRVSLLAEVLSGMDRETAEIFENWVRKEARRRRRMEFLLARDALLDLTRDRSGATEEYKEEEPSMAHPHLQDLELQEPGVLPILQGISLGHRRAMARGADSFWLERLLMDPDPGVIRNLLHNSRITEKEVLKLASRVPIPPRILRVVAESPRWASRYSVKKALVFNPCTPLEISLDLMDFMMVQDLRLLIEAEHLNPKLRSQAKALLAERGKFQSPPQWRLIKDA